MRKWKLLVLRQFPRLALSALHVLAAAASSALKSRAALQLENVALRHQLGVLRRSVKQPKLTPVDRCLWGWLSQPSLGRLAFFPAHRPTGNRHCLAPQELPTVLEVESSTRSAGPSAGVDGNPSADPKNEPREPALGGSSHPRRIAEAGRRCRGDERE